MHSISISYRLGLAMHALNNEGSDGSNFMQPRNIPIGKDTYDGISGEIIRRHILENFVDQYKSLGGKYLLPYSEALHPDRGMLAIRHFAKRGNVDELSKKNPEDLFTAVRQAIGQCAVIDVGGFLAAFSGKEGSSENKVSPEAKIDSKLSKIAKQQNAPYTVKRDSVYDAAWLISEMPRCNTATKHAAYRPDGDQSLFTQTMRSNVYGGVLRLDLHRIGTDDYWYLNPDLTNQRQTLIPGELQLRQKALVRAAADFVASPKGAKTAAWLPHVFLTEGSIITATDRTAPFISPIKLLFENGNIIGIEKNENYITNSQQLTENTMVSVNKFESVNELWAGINAILQSKEDIQGEPKTKR
jgi:CRISPR-associated autoregulator DevR family